MAEEKTVHKHYHYNETDDFASYLEQMAKEGWEFEEWTSGLVFRKSDPANVHYAVDIFQGLRIWMKGRSGIHWNFQNTVGLLAGSW